MRIVFERTGGFMGRTVTLSIDLGELPDEQAGEIRSLLQEAHFLDFDTDGEPGEGRDDFSYTITVETARVEQTIRVSDAGAPSNLRPLIDELSRLARMQRG